jgi:hypothetical protein
MAFDWDKLRHQDAKSRKEWRFHQNLVVEVPAGLRCFAMKLPMP